MGRYLLLLLLLWASQCPAARIAIIESYHHDFAWDREYVQGIEDVLAGHELRRFELDTKRIARDKFDAAADRIWLEIRSYHPELVMIADDNAFRLLSDRVGTLNVPVVFLGLNGTPRDYGLNTFPAITGVFERPLLKRSVLFLRALLGKDRPKLLVMFDASTTSAAAHDHLSQMEPHIDVGKIRVDIRLDNSTDNWKKMIEQAGVDGYDAIIIGLYHTLTESDGQYTDPEAFLAWVHDNSALPTFGFWDFSIGPRGNIGGYVLDGYEHGRTAAKMAEKILNGTPASDIYPIIDDNGRFIFSQSGMARWRLNVPKHLEGKISWVE